MSLTQHVETVSTDTKKLVVELGTDKTVRLSLEDILKRRPDLAAHVHCPGLGHEVAQVWTNAVMDDLQARYGDTVTSVVGSNATTTWQQVKRIASLSCAMRLFEMQMENSYGMPCDEHAASVQEQQVCTCQTDSDCECESDSETSHSSKIVAQMNSDSESDDEQPRTYSCNRMNNAWSFMHKFDHGPF